jgi:hypothetical protein
LDDDGAVTVFVAHVPAAILSNPEYQRCNRESATSGWMEEGMLSLFGTNSISAVPHPDGDGILIIGSAV